MRAFLCINNINVHVNPDIISYRTLGYKYRSLSLKTTTNTLHHMLEQHV